MQIAALYTALDEHDNAFDILDTLYEEHYFDLSSIAVWHYYNDLHSDQRYKDLLKKMGLPEN